ncbi:response regulator transcription factor [Pueribacillus sp. YX66]|uniref:response regulator transcription factor n=1 Tax=Pueribacillus sp. YX66 TaxID=3229242 RepID=UPI00358D2B0A
MEKEKILIVEDESKIARVIQLELEYEGYEATTARTGKEGLRLLEQHEWDLVLLDIMLPELNGIEVLRRMRSAGDVTPVILLTARDSIPDKVSGLDQGANDYMTKPFKIEELLARIRALLRTRQQFSQVDKPNEDVLTIGELSLNEKSYEVKVQETVIDLTPREFDLLKFLMKHPNQVLNREQLLSAVWGYDYYGDTNVVDVYIRYVRKKIKNVTATEYIHTVRGVGYMLKVEQS